MEKVIFRCLSTTTEIQENYVTTKDELLTEFRIFLCFTMCNGICERSKMIFLKN